MKANCVICRKEFDKLGCKKTCSKECRSEHLRQRERERSPRYREKARERRGKKYAANPENFRNAQAERMRKWRAANRERDAENRRKRRAKDPEKAREYLRNYDAANRERVSERRRKYRAAHPVKRTARRPARRREAMKANCVICGKEFEKHSRGKTCSQACSRKWANEYASRYRKANLEDVREADRERMRKKRSASPETIREVNRKSYVANREKICRRASTKRASNRANLLEKMNPHVEYRPIPGFDDWRYQLGKDASLWWRKTPNSAWRKAIVKKFIGGYLSVHLTKPSGEHVHCSLGPLMLYTFRPGTRPLGYQCHYGFKGRACCELSNLEWRPQASKKVGQPAFNFKMAERGEQNHRAKLTEAKVVEARRLYVEEGWSHEDLSMHYEVSHSTIRHALSGKTWGHVPGIVLARRPGMIGVSHGMAMLTEDEVYEIRALHRSGMSGCAIARKYEVSSTTIYGIIKGRLWSHLPDPQSRPDS